MTRSFELIHDPTLVSTILLFFGRLCVVSVAATKSTANKRIMENALYANVQKLYDNGLYECVIPTVSTWCYTASHCI